MPRIRITAPTSPEGERLLSTDALEFLTELHDRFRAPRQDVLSERQESRRAFSNGRYPAFRPDTAGVRADDSWQVAPPALGLEDRRVEIAGPVNDLAARSALASGAKVWLADLEDSTSPTWENIVGGQLTLHRAVRGELSQGGSPTIAVRPRGWHLAEKHLRYTGRDGVEVSTSASLVDFGLFFFHNAAELVRCGVGPYFYLAKLESSEEARLWNDIFLFAQERLGIQRGTVRATVLVETVTAAFQMDEILYELREHSSGLNAGRWDYAFSIIKNFRHRRRFVLSDRDSITMKAPFMQAFTSLLIATAHRRGAHAIGGLSSLVPDRDNPGITADRVAAVVREKEREAAAGFDGSWVADAGLVDAVRGPFDAVLGERPHQLDVRPRTEVSAADLIDIGDGTPRVSERAVRENLRIALSYIDAWLQGRGVVRFGASLEDASTAELARSQVWQWVHHGISLDDGRVLTRPLAQRMLVEEQAGMMPQPGDRLDEAAEILAETALGEELPTFFTIPAYTRHLVSIRQPAVGYSAA